MRVAIMILCLSPLAACGAAVADRPQDEKAAREAVSAANAAKDRAMVKGDPAVLASFYTEDYRIIDDRAGIHDKSDQVDFMANSVDVLEARSDEVKVDMLSPDAALLIGADGGTLPDGWQGVRLR